MARARQSVAKLAAKGAIRTTGKRVLADRLGTGLFGSIVKAVFLHGVRVVDKRL